MMIKQFGSKRQYTKMWSDDDDFHESDSNEIDSDVEFHLYSQIHYSTDDFGSTHKESTLLEQNFGQVLLSTEDENRSSPQKDDFPPVHQEPDDSEPSRSVQSFSKEDITMLKKHLANDDDDFIPEPWEIVDSISNEDSDDLGVDIHISQPQEDEDDDERNEAWIPGKGSEESWKIDERDKMKLDGKSRYFAAEAGGSRMRCRNCDNTGHKAKDCPEQKALPVCFMCGNRGHIGRDCGERKNHKFAHRHVECNRCRQEGHMRLDCPDLWRQFHVTTEPGPINVPRIPIKLNKNMQCYNCAGDGHFGHECEEQRYQSYCPMLLKPFVHRYDRHVVDKVPKDLRKKLKAKHSAQEGRTTHQEPQKGRTKAKRLNTRIVFRSPSPQINKKHQESQGRNRKNDLDRSLSFKTKKNRPESTRRKKDDVVGENRKGRERYNSSENYDHASQRFDEGVSFKAKKHRPESTRRKKDEEVGENQKGRERYNSSENYHHASQRVDERVVSTNQRKHRFQSSKKKQNIERKVTHEQGYSEPNSRGFKRRYF